MNNLNAQMTGHNLEITPAIREFTEKKLTRLKPHADSITSIHITFNIDHHDQVAEAQVTVPGQAIHAKASSSESLYTAIDALIDKLSRQLIKYKEKHKDHR